MYCWNLRLRRDPVRLWFTEDKKECMNTAHRRFRRIVNLRVVVTVLVKFLHALACARAQVIQSAKHDRLGWTYFCAGGYEPALLAIVAKGAFECTACIGKRLGSAIDHTEWTGNDAVAAAIAHRSEEHTSELQSHSFISYAVFCF